jgi:hypothetical protein
MSTIISNHTIVNIMSTYHDAVLDTLSLITLEAYDYKCHSSQNSKAIGNGSGQNYQGVLV